MHWPKKWPRTNLQQNINSQQHTNNHQLQNQFCFGLPHTYSTCHRKWQDFVALPQRAALLGCNLAIGNTCGKVPFHVPCRTAAANHSTDKWHYCKQSQHRQAAQLQPVTEQTAQAHKITMVDRADLSIQKRQMARAAALYLNPEIV